MTYTAGTELREALSERDLQFLELLEWRVIHAATPPRPRGNLYDLERIAGIIDGDQLQMVLQPIIDLGSGQVVGYEALSRFQVLPRRSPDVWFAQAARVGLAVELEMKALHQSFALLETLDDDCFLSVNVSAPSLSSSALYMELGRVPAERIVLELTEHELIDDYDALNDAIADLRARGFRVAVDDAGAGCAGYSHILQIAPDIIKLDQTIVRSIDQSSVNQEMAASIVALAGGLGAVVLAEGIETAAELDVVTRLGVQEGQGYLLGRPGPFVASGPAAS